MFKPGILILSLSALSGCAAALIAPIPLRTTPVAAVVATPAGKTYELTGQMKINTNFNNTFKLATAAGDVTCTGGIDRVGDGTIACSGGLGMKFTVPKDQVGGFNGSFVDQKAQNRVALGWGTGADLKGLHARLAN